ncbi:hypothetical protein HDZ31DRAFT_80767 [Schizophyllum fasciatum]
MINALKTPSFFRPASRPSSPGPAPSRPDSAGGLERVARPLNKLSSFSALRKPSPAPVSKESSPASTLVQDGSYMEMLSLKLSESVSKALAQPAGPATAAEQLNGRRPIPHGRGTTLGNLIASEIKAAQDNSHLLRAIYRTLQRPFSVLITNLSGALMPLLTSPAFLSPPAPHPGSPNPNPTQLHALAIAQFSAELLHVFDEIGLAQETDTRGDGLRHIREGLVSFINRTVQPLIGGIKSELNPLLDSIENHTQASSTKVASGTKAAVHLHASVVTLQTAMPVHARALSRYMVSPVAQAPLAALIISAAWHAMMALVHRPPVPSTPPSSPASTSRKRRSSPSSTPPVTPPPGRFAIKLPPSRPPSPPLGGATASAAADARALVELFKLLPRPTEKLAADAVDEAMKGLAALVPLLETVQAMPRAKLGIHDAVDDDFERQLEEQTQELPTLICLPVLLHAYGGGSGSSVAHILGLTEDEYRRGCLSGFARAEECADAVGARVLDVLRQDAAVPRVVVQWLERELLE